MKKDIEYRQVKHDAKCSICEVDIFKHDEKVIVLPWRGDNKQSYIICNDCLQSIEDVVIEGQRQK